MSLTLIRDNPGVRENRLAFPLSQGGEGVTPLPRTQIRHPVPPFAPTSPLPTRRRYASGPTSDRLLRLLRLGRSRTSLKSSLRSASMRGMVLAVSGSFLRRRRCEGRRRQPGTAGRVRTAAPGWLCADWCSVNPVRTPCSYTRVPRAPRTVSSTPGAAFRSRPRLPGPAHIPAHIPFPS